MFSDFLLREILNNSQSGLLLAVFSASPLQMESGVLLLALDHLDVACNIMALRAALLGELLSNNESDVLIVTLRLRS